MTLDDGQYERLAAVLDGDAGLPEEPLRRAAEEIRRGEALLGAMLDVSVPPEGLERVRARLRARLRRPRLALRVAAIGGALAAAAAAVLVVVSLIPTPEPARPAPAGRRLAPIAVEDILRMRQDSPLAHDIDALAHEVSRFEADVMLSFSPDPADLHIQAIQRAIDDFSADLPPPPDPGAG